MILNLPLLLITLINNVYVNLLRKVNGIYFNL